MHERFKSWFGLNAGVGTIMGVMTVVILSASGLPVFPAIWIYVAIVVGFSLLYLFHISAEIGTTVRCGLIGHKMRNTRLDNGVRTYECKRSTCYTSVKETVK